MHISISAACGSKLALPDGNREENVSDRKQSLKNLILS